MPIHPVASHSTQIVIDLHGAPVSQQHLLLGENCVGRLWGFEVQPLFWITRIDLASDYESRNPIPGVSGRLHVGSETRHEPSFDLYHDGGIVPILRIINVRIPTFDQGDYLETKPDPRPDPLPSSPRAASTPATGKVKPWGHVGATEDC